jgi:hypothetical protein
VPRPIAASVLIPALAALWCSAADRDFTMELQARVSGRQDTVHGGNTPNSPATLTAKAGDSLIVQGSALNPMKGASIPDVTLHVSLDRIPKTGGDAVYESALVMNFEPGSKSSAELLLQAPAAGDYLLRVETIGAAKKLEREYFAAMDLKVQ